VLVEDNLIIVHLESVQVEGNLVIVHIEPIQVEGNPFIVHIAQLKKVLKNLKVEICLANFNNLKI